MELQACLVPQMNPIFSKMALVSSNPHIFASLLDTLQNIEMTLCKMFCFCGRSSVMLFDFALCLKFWLHSLMLLVTIPLADRRRVQHPQRAWLSRRPLAVHGSCEAEQCKFITPSLLRSGVKRFAVRHNGNAFSKSVVHSNLVLEPTVDGQNLASSH